MARTDQKSAMLLLLLVPFFLECFNGDMFLINLPGSPLTFGDLCMTAFGGMMLLLHGPRKSTIFNGMVLIYVGGIVGSFFSEDVVTNLSNAMGKIVLIFGVWGLATSFRVYYKRLMDAMDVLMTLSLAYWAYYVLSRTLLSGKFVSYTALFLSGRALNHHIVGIQVSVAAIYVAGRLYSTPGLLRNISYGVLCLAVVCCLLIESRSNTIMVIVSALWLIFQERKIKPVYLLISLIVIYAMYTFAISFLAQYSFLEQRFNIDDGKYQTATNQSRLYIYQNYPATFLQHPLGMGFEAPRMVVGYMVLNMHNQFLTYMLAGGLLGVIGVILFWKKFLQILRYNRLKTLPEAMFSHTRALTGMVFVFTFTLLTVENGGALFLLVTAVSVFLETQYDLYKKSEKSETPRFLNTYIDHV